MRVLRVAREGRMLNEINRRVSEGIVLHVTSGSYEQKTCLI